MKRTLFQLQVGDVVLEGGEDWLVEGILVLEGGTHPVRLARLWDGRHDRWLASGGDELVLLRGRPGERPSLPPPTSLVIEGQAMKLVAAGGGAVVRHGDCGSRSADTCRYWRYQGPAAARAWIDDFPAADLLVGAVVSAELLDLLPGS
jgi:hypothetical protein